MADERELSKTRNSLSNMRGGDMRGVVVVVGTNTDRRARDAAKDAEPKADGKPEKN